MPRPCSCDALVRTRPTSHRRGPLRERARSVRSPSDAMTRAARLQCRTVRRDGRQIGPNGTNRPGLGSRTCGSSLCRPPATGLGESFRADRGAARPASSPETSRLLADSRRTPTSDACENGMSSRTASNASTMARPGQPVRQTRLTHSTRRHQKPCRPSRGLDLAARLGQNALPPAQQVRYAASDHLVSLQA